MAKKTALNPIITLIFSLSFTAPLTGFIEVSVPYHARAFPGEPRIDKSELWSIDMRISGTTKSLCHFKPNYFNHLHFTETAFFLACNPAKHAFATLFIPLDHVHQSRAANRPLDWHTAGPVTMTIGATGSYLSHPLIDFIDFSVETGITLPSPGDIGSNSAGLPLKGIASIGIFDWITTGLEADVILFFHPESGFQENICWYLKADHFMRGFSAHIGYSYSKQYNAPLIWYGSLPCWYMHTLHLSASFDAARERHPALPWVEFFYDRVLSGRNIAGYSMIGFRCGVNF